jgi:nitrite reductase/ring-hydroxylating ferredoxin subunit
MMTMPNGRPTHGDASAGTSRRTVLAVTGLAATGVAGTALLSACGAGSSTGSADTGGPAAAVVAASDIGVGQAKILAASRVVVTQPTAGVFKAFSAICTHQGCLVSDIANGKIRCPCHNSEFSLTDGSVVIGPATRGLDRLTVTVSGDTLTIA